MALDTSKVKLPASVVNEMVAKASDVSTIAALSPAVPQLFADSQHMLFMPSAEAEVVAEGARKGAYEQSVKCVEGKRVKLVTTTRVSDELKWADEDSRLQIVAAIQADQLAALGRAIDYVIYHAINPKSGEGLDGYTSLVSQATSVTGTEDEVDNLDKLSDALIDYDANGIAVSREFASALRKYRVPATGQRLYPEVPMSLDVSYIDGVRAVASGTVNGRLAKTQTNVRAIMGDFNTIKWGMVRDVTAEVIEYGDPDNTGVDLKGSNQVAYRTESMFSYALLDPKAFAVLKSA